MKRSVGLLVLAAVLALVPAGCDVFNGEASAEYEAATKSWNAGDYHEAVKQYIDLVRKHPSSSRADDALYWAGVTQFLYLGETEKALQTLQLLMKRYPRGDMAPDAQWYIAQIYELWYSDYERAVGAYRKAAAYADQEVREKSLYSLAENLFLLGREKEARETWLQQVTEFPSGPRSRLAYYRLGTAAFSVGDLEKARIYYRKTLENGTDPELTVKAKFALAGCLEAAGDLHEALALYRELQPVYPNPDAIEVKIKAIKKRIAKKRY